MTWGGRPDGRVMRADVCVVGGGPAGIAVARDLARSAVRVLVVEAGCEHKDAAAQAATWGEMVSDHYGPDALCAGRRRQYGGTTNIWSHVTKPDDGRVYARVLPGEAVDFEPRSWQETAGWPFGLEELRPYYERVCDEWVGRPLCNDPGAWSRPDSPELPLAGGPLRTRMAQYGARDVILDRWHRDLVLAPDVTIHTGSTVVSLDSDASGRVRRASVVTLAGEAYVVEAELFVLAGGGIENVQTLLHSDVTRPGGPGNRHDVVGRYVTDHPEFLMGTVEVADVASLERLRLYDMHHVDGAVVSGVLTLDEATKRDQQLLNMAAVIVPRPRGFATPAERALRSLQGPLAQGRRPEAVREHLRVLAGSPADTAAVLDRKLFGRFRPGDYPGGYVWHRGGWSRVGVDRSPLRVLELHAATEQSSRRENAFELLDRRDALGRQRMRLRLAWSEADKANMLRSAKLLGAEMERIGLGRWNRWVEFEGPTRPVDTGIHHPMGGTRMHEDPRLGVVDRDCRVHGVPNLYVAGTSVFTTGLGYANPTLTVLALAARLAEHLRRQAGLSEVAAVRRRLPQPGSPSVARVTHSTSGRAARQSLRTSLSSAGEWMRSSKP